MLAWLEDVIFEGLPNRLAKTWPERFLSSIAPGRDLSPVGWQFLHWLLTESRLSEFDHIIIDAEVARCAEALVPLIDRRPADVSAAERAATVARTAMDTVSRIEGLPEAVAWGAENAALAAESAALSGFNPAAGAERAVTATSSAIAGSKDSITISEKQLELLAALWRERMEGRGMDPEFRLIVSAPTDRDAHDIGLAVRAEMRAMSRLGEDKLTI